MQAIQSLILNVGVYCRLSRDDGADSESSSIQSQKEYITEFIEKKGWNLVNYYCDDGYSGTNFERPGFKTLLADIERKKINCVITKDLSRLGRNYIETGKYIEEYFPTKNVRYIAINDNYDTGSDIDNDFAPFKNIINEWYAKDISKKVKSSFLMKRKNGELIAGQPLYGYCYANGVTKRIISEPEANVVRLIYELYLKEKQIGKVRDYLVENKIHTPKYALYKKYGWFKDFFAGKPDDYKYNWNPEMIRKILTDEEYTGKVIVNKKKKLSFKTKKFVKVAPENHIVHDAPQIIELKTFKEVQLIINRNKSLREPLTKDLLRGFVYCPRCGKRMYFIKRTIHSKKGKEFNKTYMAYNCHNNECQQNIIAQDSLNKIIEDELLLIKKLILENKDKFLNLCNETYYKKQNNVSLVSSVNKDKIKELEEMSKNLDKKIEFLITGRADGSIPVSTYNQLMKKYGDSKNDVEAELKTLLDNKNIIKSNDGFNYLEYCENLIEVLLSTDDKSILNSNLIEYLIYDIKPKSTRKYVKSEGKVKCVLSEVEITYYKIDEIIKGLMQNE